MVGSRVSEGADSVGGVSEGAVSCEARASQPHAGRMSPRITSAAVGASSLCRGRLCEILELAGAPAPWTVIAPVVRGTVQRDGAPCHLGRQGIESDMIRSGVRAQAPWASPSVATDSGLVEEQTHLLGRSE